MKRVAFALILLLMLVQISAFAQVSAVPALMNFQGRLTKPDGTPVSDGNYLLKFTLFDAVTAGTQKWTQTLNPVAVHRGVFAVLLSGFPAGTFNGNLWLEIKVGNDPPLTPRQQLVTVAYAFKANSVPDASIGSAQLANGAVTTAKIASGAVTAAQLAPGLLNSLSWLLGGNSGTTSSNFLGTTDNQPLEMRSNNWRAMRYSYAQNTATMGSEFRSMNVLGGSSVNTIAAGVVGGTIAGGGKNGFNGTNAPNDVEGDFGIIGGGLGNIVYDLGSGILGGSSNIAQGQFSAIGGGASNNTQADYSVIAGGQTNYVGGLASTVSGGLNNTVSGASSTIGGGQGNTAIGVFSTVGGGVSNTASGAYSTVSGGGYNTASGMYSFAGGYEATASDSGSFVWNDGFNSQAFSSSAAHQFCIRSTGGIVLEQEASPLLFTASTSGEHNRYLELLNSPQTENASGLKAGGILCADSYAYSNPGKNDMTIKGRAALGFDVNTTGYTLAVNGSVYCIGFTNASDIRWKQNIAPVDQALEAVLNLRGVTFDWKPTGGMRFPEGRQIGFIAQEVERVLPELVTTDQNGYKSVAYQNVVPVLVEAMKTLKRDNDAKQKQIEDLKARVKSLASLEARLAALEKRLQQP